MSAFQGFAASKASRCQPKASRCLGFAVSAYSFAVSIGFAVSALGGFAVSGGFSRCQP